LAAVISYKASKLAVRWLLDTLMGRMESKLGFEVGEVELRTVGARLGNHFRKRSTPGNC